MCILSCGSSILFSVPEPRRLKNQESFNNSADKSTVATTSVLRLLFGSQHLAELERTKEVCKFNDGEINVIQRIFLVPEVITEVPVKGIFVKLPYFTKVCDRPIYFQRVREVGQSEQSHRYHAILFWPTVRRV